MANIRGIEPSCDGWLTAKSLSVFWPKASKVCVIRLLISLIAMCSEFSPFWLILDIWLFVRSRSFSSVSLLYNMQLLLLHINYNYMLLGSYNQKLYSIL